MAMTDERKRIAEEALRLREQLAPSMAAIQDAIKSVRALPDMDALKALIPPPSTLAKELAEASRLIAQQSESMQSVAREIAATCRAARDAMKQAGGFELAASTTKGLAAAFEPPKGLLEAGRIMAGLSEQAAQTQQAFASSILAAQESMKGMGALGLDASTLKALTFPNIPRLSFEGFLGSQEALREAVEGMRASMSLGATLAKALEIPPFLRDLHLPTAEEMEEGLQRFVRAAEALARGGWTFPMQMTLREVVELAEDGALDPQKLDRWFLDYYADRDGREYRALARRLRKSKRLASWRPLLVECLRAYQHGLYRVVVPALFATIEGLVCEATGTVQATHGKPPTNWQNRIARPKGAFLEAQWCATTAFLESLWRRHEFDKPAPGTLNRHWTVHGRRPHVGDRADALRLLAAVDFISYAATSVERLAKKASRKDVA
jgi:hypothetical protein